MPSHRKVQGYGWIPDQPDHRDRIFNLEEEVKTLEALPPKVDLRETNSMPPVWDQGQLGSCTANGVMGCIVFDALKQGETVQGLSNDDSGYSRLFLYYNERVIEGTADWDSGAQVRDGIKSMVSQGAPPESEWPYNINRFTDKPSQSVYNDATAHEALVYKRIIPDGRGAPIHTALANGYPVVFGFSVPATFEDGSWDPASGAPLPLPGPNIQFIGGHCTVIVGYDHTRNDLLIVRNSWSTGWGMDGYFNMHHGYVDPWRGLTDDFWVVYTVK